MTTACSLKVKGPKGLSTVGVDRSYGVFEVSKIDNCGEAGNEFAVKNLVLITRTQKFTRFLLAVYCKPTEKIQCK